MALWLQPIGYAIDNPVNILHNMINPEGLIFLHGEHTPRCIATVDKMFTYHTLQFMTSGGVDAWYGDAPISMRGAWLWPTWPGVRVRFHEYPRGKHWHHRYIAFEGPIAAAWKAEGLAPEHPIQIADSRDAVRLSKVFDELLTQSIRQDLWGRRRAVNLLERLLIEAMEIGRSIQTSSAPWLRDVIKLLQQWDREPDYKQIALEAGLSLSTLRRHFHESTGVALHTFRLQSRIATARQMLGETDTPIKSIAETLGYRDVFYFSRQFTQYVGVPPAKYRATRQI